MKALERETETNEQKTDESGCSANIFALWLVTCALKKERRSP